MYQITYQIPYTQEWRVSSFSTLEEAQRMVEFYRSCGSPSHPFGAELLNNDE